MKGYVEVDRKALLLAACGILDAAEKSIDAAFDVLTQLDRLTDAAEDADLPYLSHITARHNRQGLNLWHHREAIPERLAGVRSYLLEQLGKVEVAEASDVNDPGEE